MKAAGYLIVALGLLVLLTSCFLSNPWLGTGEGDSVYLPPDIVNDTARSFSEPFEFKTLLPVSLNLEIEFYEVNAATSAAALQEVFLEAGKAVVEITDSEGNVIYEGGVQADGILNAQLALPAAPEDMVLTVKAQGFEDRSITIADLVNYSEINRKMGLMSEGVSAKGQALPDSDGDLVPDVYDAFPYDPDVAFTVRVPDEESLTVAFEDLYLRERAGDADYNDFLAQYNITEYYNGENKLTKIEGEAMAKVKIAGYNHLFGLAIGYEKEVGEDLAVSILATNYDNFGNKQEDVSIPPIENITTPSNATYKNKAIVPLFESTKDAIGKTAHFVVDFEPAIDRSRVELAPFDPYLYVYNTTYDIHLIGKDPLPDTKNPPESYTTVAFNFMDEAGFPWALLVPKDWQHPAETQFIEELYPSFKFWREANGANYSNWYLLPLDPAGNNPPYPVSGSVTNPEYPANQNKLQFYQLTIKKIADLEDPDGDAVYFRSNELPDYMNLDENSGLVTIDNAPPGEVTAYFWSEDQWGASTEANPLKVTFTFIAGPTLYERIVIETHSPNGSFTADTYIDLFNVSGDPDADDPWTGDDTTQVIAWDDNSNPELSGTFARIDYTGGLTPGIYYIRVRGATETVNDFYAIRVVSLNPGDTLPPYDYQPLESRPDSYEAAPGDDEPKSGGVPLNPVSINLGQTISRSIDYDSAAQEGDIDWFKLVLE